MSCHTRLYNVSSKCHRKLKRLTFYHRNFFVCFLIAYCPSVNFSIFYLLFQNRWAMFIARECFSDERCGPWASYCIPKMCYIFFKIDLINNLNSYKNYCISFIKCIITLYNKNIFHPMCDRFAHRK